MTLKEFYSMFSSCGGVVIYSKNYKLYKVFDDHVDSFVWVCENTEYANKKITFISTNSDSEDGRTWTYITIEN